MNRKAEHIGFLTPEYPHELTGRSGGIGTSIHNLARSLSESGKRVTVFVSGQSEDSCFQDEDINIVRIKNVKVKGFSWWLTRRKIGKEINKCIQKNALDVLEAPDWGGLSAFVKLECPVVIRCNGSDTYFCYLEKRTQKRWNFWLEKRALRSADAILSVSKYTASVTSQLFQIPEHKFKVIHNGIRTDTFSKAETFQEGVILYFGTLIRKKGLLELPEIFNKVADCVPGARLVLIGGDSRDVLTGQSTWALMKSLFRAEYLNRVEYKGPRPYQGLIADISSAHVCVFPSFVEAFPVSWLEAMACGKAIVASNIGWAPECITDGEDGFLVDPRDHHTFADRIVTLLNDSELCSQLGKRASEKVRNNFSSEIIARQSADFYARIINE